MPASTAIRMAFPWSRPGPWLFMTACLVALGSAFCGSAVDAAPAEVAIPGDHVYPESITSTADGTLYVGSMGDGVIMRVPPGGSQAEPWVKAGSNGLLSVAGVLADEGTQTLWACSGDLSAAGVVMKAGEKPGGLKSFDLKTGAAKGAYALPGSRTFCNDMVLAKDGTLYVTDSSSPHILRLAPGGKRLEVWAEDERFKVEGGAGLDGIALGSDGNIYVNTYKGGGLFRVAVGEDGKAGQVTTLRPSSKIDLPDALRSIGPNTFLMIEGAGRLDRITVTDDSAKVDVVHDGYKLPVSVTVVGNTAWVLEGQLNHLFDRQTGKPDPFKAYAVTDFSR